MVPQPRLVLLESSDRRQCLLPVTFADVELNGGRLWRTRLPELPLAGDSALGGWMRARNNRSRKPSFDVVAHGHVVMD